MSHYFTDKPQTPHDEKLLTTTLRGREFSFYTDSGVFSKDAVDFGSRTLIETMVIPDGAAVLDMGCGWGPVGITAARINPAGTVLLVDVNTRALALAERNIIINNVTNATTLASDLYAKLEAETFDIILTNPPIRAGKSVVHAIFSGAVDRLNSDGSLWVVMQKKQGAPSAEKRLRELFREVHIRARNKGYYVFRAVK